MSKRAVSPLIAAILLIALTVSIGAMIIGWGKQYVQQQTSCLGASATITDVDATTGSTKKIVIDLENSGSQPIIAKNLIVYVYDVNGNKHQLTASSSNTFSISGTSGKVLRPGQSGTIVVDNKNFTGINFLADCDQIISVEIAVQGCGVISNRYSVYKCHKT